MQSNPPGEVREMRDRLLEQLAQHPELPEFPQLLGRLEELYHDPEADLGAISELISTDPVLVGRVLKLANSALYGSGRKDIVELREAVQRLGLNELRKIAYSIGLSELFQSNSLLDHRAFWRHNLAVALFAQSLHRFISTSRDLRERSYLGGLMHDVGLMVFATLIPEEYGRFLVLAREREIPLHDQEAEYFGIDHAELGAEFIRMHWFEDATVISAIRQHHFPFLDGVEERELGQIIHLANAICDNVGIQNGVDVMKAPFEEGAWIRLGLHLEDANKILAAVNQALENTETMLEV